MTGPNSRPYRVRRSLEDMLALLVAIEDHQRCIFEHAFHEGSWDAVFDEARNQGQTIRQLGEFLRRSWCEIQQVIDGQRQPALEEEE